MAQRADHEQDPEVENSRYRVTLNRVTERLEALDKTCLLPPISRSNTHIFRSDISGSTY